VYMKVREKKIKPIEQDIMKNFLESKRLHHVSLLISRAC